ncbi:MAG: peptidoglycan-binding domain-containing protein [Paracoccaceae bacterium]
MLRQAMVAIIDCTPIVSGGGEKSIYGRFEIVVNLDGLSLANVEALVGRVNIVPTFDDLKVGIEDAVAPAEVAPAVAAPAIMVATDTTPSPRATLADEKEIELSRTDRREIQRRLVLLGYDTRGVDGVFGDGSRSAIRRWQQDSSLPISGYLDLNQLAVLRAVSQDLSAEWDARPKRYYDKNGCLREPNGAIVQGRSFKCDLSAASQSLGITK